MLKPRLLLLVGLFLAALISVAQDKLVRPSAETNHAPALPPGKDTTAAVPELSAKEVAQRYEKVRAACIQGRRRICGRVVEISTNGLVVDSGFTSLLRPELSRSWVAPASVLAERPPNLIEESTAGAPAAGLVLLTNTPRRPTPKLYGRKPGAAPPLRPFFSPQTPPPPPPQILTITTTPTLSLGENTIKARAQTGKKSPPFSPRKLNPPFPKTWPSKIHQYPPAT